MLEEFFDKIKHLIQKITSKDNFEIIEFKEDGPYRLEIENPFAGSLLEKYPETWKEAIKLAEKKANEGNDVTILEIKRVYKTSYRK